ncbi:MAG TPA: outer membrane protein assembly factor BamD, partial [Gemmatimonadota bacterium]|nr:outer membrane protein assembly factor BamD [Gemmatimonadota bacterium]
GIVSRAGWWLMGTALALGLGACASSGGTAVLPADEQFQEATRFFENGQYDRAVGAFQAFVFNYPQDSRVPDARWLAAESYYRMEDWATAAQEYLNYQRDFPREERAAEAIYQAGRAYQEMSLRPELDQRDTERAINVYDRLLVEYPSSELVAETRERVAELRNKLAEKVYLNAEFYFDHEDFEAAEIYLADLIATFPQTEWIPAAYALLARTFCAQGLSDRAADVFARLREAFPDSRAAREVDGQLPGRCVRSPAPEQAAGSSDGG